MSRETAKLHFGLSRLTTGVACTNGLPQRRPAATNLGDPTTRLILGNSLSMRSLRGRTPHPRAGSGLGRSDLTPTDGVIGLGELKIRSVAHRQAEISYAVHTVLWGQGYGEAIARSLVEVGRAEGMHRIAGTCDPRNGASARVLQKIGMSYEGRMRHTPEQPEKDEPGWSPTLRPPRQRDVWVAARGWRRPHAATMSASCSQRQKRPCLSGDPRVHPRIGRESCALWQP